MKFSLFVLVFFSISNLVFAKTATLLFTGDHLGYYGVVETPPEMAFLKLKIEEERKKNPDIFLLDSGNFLGPYFASRFDEGQFISESIQKLQYDAINLGYHDFNYGLNRLSELKQKFNLPLTSINILQKDTKASFVPEYLILNRGDVKLAVIGITDPELIQKNLNKKLNDIQMRDLSQVLTPVLNDLVSKVDLLVVLANLNFKQAVELAERNPQIDIVLTKSLSPEEDKSEYFILDSTSGLRKKALIIPSSRYGKKLGKLTIEIDKKGIKTFDPQFIKYDSKVDESLSSEIKNRLKDISDTHNKQIIPDVKKTFGGILTSEIFLRLFLRMLKEEGRAEISLINKSFFYNLDSAIQKHINQSNQILESHLQILFWTNNTLSKALYTGRQLEKIYSELSPAIEILGLEQKNGTLFVNGRRLNSDEKYSIASSSYLMSFTSPLPTLAIPAQMDFEMEKNTVDLRRSFANYLRTFSLDKETQYEGLWKINFDSINLKISNLDANGTNEYPKISDSRVQAKNMRTFDSDARISLIYDSKNIDWINTFESQFVKYEFEKEDLISKDKLTGTIQLNLKFLTFPEREINFTPFVSSWYETEYKKKNDLPRNRLLFAATGLTTTFGNFFNEFRFGPNVHYNLTDSRYSRAFGSQVYYRFNKKLWESPISFDSTMDGRYFFDYSINQPDSFKYSVDLKNKILVPFFKDFYLSPFMDLFWYKINTIPVNDRNLNYGLALTYTRLWKVGTESFF